jgi:trehalose utilization protein
MPLYHIKPHELPRVWPTVAPMLQRAIDLDPELNTIEQVEYAVRIGRTHLLVWDEPGEGITGSVTVDIIDYPRERVAHVNLMGGKGIVRTHVFDEAKNWMRLMGATTTQCWAKGTLVQMYEKMGLTNTHQVMREKL